ncbi:Methyltransferase [Spraguea lophii 42_110]|uniref:tRNA N(3)-methylcytidine methyltransferase n=1 Tax=Spraguea lophii (strain 42_110) TaxID=1358809 RepID=S7W939_SPRLO|nr:Methyltransferase [Spraguea lophii 42_110]
MERKRLLTDHNLKDNHNAWDDVSLSGEDLENAISKIESDNISVKENTSIVEIDDKYWNDFYKKYQDTFFRDRKWMKEQYSELFIDNQKILEIGCGAGNSLSLFDFEKNKIMGCDYSENSINICKQRYPQGTFFVHDITKDDIPKNNFDAITLIFTLSAIDPLNHKKVINRIKKSLKTNGLLYFRDYGFLDLVQIRSKKIIKNNFYQQPDGTYRYFFKLDEVKELMKDFEIIKIEEQKKLLYNRKKKIEMHRIQVNGIFRKK